MGFDLSGMNPNMTRPEPELPPFPERTDKDWEKYHDWQEEKERILITNRMTNTVSNCVGIINCTNKICVSQICTS